MSVSVASLDETDETEDTSSDESVTYTEDELTAMTIAQIKALAEELGYTITATKKADVIAEFLEQQGE